MKELLVKMKTALDRVETFPSRLAELQKAKDELPDRIKSLTALAGKGDSKAAIPLTMSRARLETLSGEISDLRREEATAVCELRDLVLELSSEVAKLWNNERERMEKIIGKFLDEHLEGVYLRDELCREILNNSKKMNEMDKIKSRFVGLYTFNLSEKNDVVRRAEFALENLQHV